MCTDWQPTGVRSRPSYTVKTVFVITTTAFYIGYSYLCIIRISTCTTAYQLSNPCKRILHLVLNSSSNSGLASNRLNNTYIINGQIVPSILHIIHPYYSIELGTSSYLGSSKGNGMCTPLVAYRRQLFNSSLSYYSTSISIRMFTFIKSNIHFRIIS